MWSMAAWADASKSASMRRRSSGSACDHRTETDFGTPKVRSTDFTTSSATRPSARFDDPALGERRRCPVPDRRLVAVVEVVVAARECRRAIGATDHVIGDPAGRAAAQGAVDRTDRQHAPQPARRGHDGQAVTGPEEARAQIVPRASDGGGGGRLAAAAHRTRTRAAPPAARRRTRGNSADAPEVGSRGLARRRSSAPAALGRSRGSRWRCGRATPAARRRGR